MDITTVPAVSVAESSPVDWRKSIHKHAITCLECALAFRQLSRRHLMMHGLDPRSYRMKYGMPRSQPLTARATTERRRQVVQAVRPWEKAPTYIKGHTQNGAALPEPEAEAVQEQIDEPVAVTSARPKRQRKATSKRKTAGMTQLDV
jgi:hypothetical protein